MAVCYFDRDGTLVDHTASFEETFETARRAVGVPTTSNVTFF